MKIIRVIAVIIGITLLLFVSFLAWIRITDLKPDEKENLSVSNNQTKRVPVEGNLTLTTYNIGYGVLDKSQDFFADGGRNSRAASLDQVNENIQAIVATIDGTEPDFFVLQEVDRDSSRSYGVDQVEIFKVLYPNFGTVFGINYRVSWVPVPLSRPMGKVHSGIMTFSKYHVLNASRHEFPGEEPWPVRLFELNRCFTESRIEVENGRELVLINLHLSAFDKGGIIRIKQLNHLKNHLEWEFAKGNYIIAAGDWNHNLPGTDPFEFDAGEPWPFWLKNIPDDYHVKGYNWAVDPETPTVRTLENPYEEGWNFLAVIDGFLLSENIQIVSAQAVDTGFENSDHNPVKLIFNLK